MSHLDDAIVEQYVRFDTPADQIVSDPELAEEFRQAVNQELSPEEQVALSDLNRRVLNLRKRGKDKGGLPRLRRSYHGRMP